MSEVMSAAALATALDGHPEWTGSTTSIERTMKAPDFMTGIRIVDEVAAAAETANHHPDIDIRWRTLRFVLSSHDVGGVTQRDLSLAEQIDRIAADHGAA